MKTAGMISGTLANDLAIQHEFAVVRTETGDIISARNGKNICSRLCGHHGSKCLILSCDGEQSILFQVEHRNKSVLV